MKIEIFNSMGFKAGDIVRVKMNNGTEEIIELERGEVYMGTPERKYYLTGQLIPATPPQIVVKATWEQPEGRGIPISEVESV